MLILRVCQALALWGLLGASVFYAWMTSVSAVAFDARVRWGFLWAFAAWAGGLVVLAALRRRAPLRWPRLGATRHGLALIVAALCAHAISHVVPQLTVRVLREEAPPLFLALYPLIAGLTPLLLSSGARTRDAGWQALLLVTASFSLSGTILFLDAPTAAWLGLLALSLQIRPGQHKPAAVWTAWLAGLFVALCVAASIWGHNPFAAHPAQLWIVGLSAAGLAVGLAPRGERAWRDLLAAAVLPAVVVAVCGVIVTAALAGTIAPGPALRTRLVLFRQHPNFLAPYYGFHAVLALGLAVSALGVRRMLWIASALLLMASTVLTDSRTGIAAMALSAVLFPGFYLGTALARRLGAMRLLLAATVVACVASAALMLGGAEHLASRIDRFEDSLDFRVDAWRNALLVIERHPWLGVGPHTFLTVADFEPGSRFYNARESPHPHNVLLYVASSAGLPAVAVFAAWVVAVFVLLWRRALAGGDPAQRPLLIAALAALVGLIAANLLDLGMALISVAPAPLFLLTGLAAAPAAAREPRETRPWHLLAWAAALSVLLLVCAARPLAALGLKQQGLLLAYESDQRLDTGLKRKALSKIEQALALEPLTPELHGLLAWWKEQQPQGFGASRALLEQRVALAPRDGMGHSLLAHSYLRLKLWREAEGELVRSLADPQGGIWHSRDRAALIQCVAQLGRREEALELLVAAMDRDLGVLANLPWMDSPQPPHRLEVAAGADRPLELIEAAELLFQRQAEKELAGFPQGRSAWMDVYRSFRIAGADDRAAVVLDWLESNGVAEVEDWTLLAERGELALSAGDPGRARESFERAYAINPLPFYRQRISHASAALGEPAQAIESVASALLVNEEIIDRPDDFRANLDAMAASQIAHGDPGGAAATLERSLLFHDDLLDRARLWEHIGSLYQQAGRNQDCERALAQALTLLAAKPFSWRDLQLDLADVLPFRIARTLTAAWDRQRTQPRERLRRAWGLPRFFDARQGPSLFRLGFYAENGLTDHLLRESELQLLIDPHNLYAHWMKLAALEAAWNRLDELPDAMRACVESYARHATPERQFSQLAAELAADPARQDAEACTQLGLLSLLRGRYAESIGLFQHARDRAADPAAQARLCGWQALAAWLVDEPEQALAFLEAGLALDPGSALLQAQLTVARGALVE